MPLTVRKVRNRNCYQVKNVKTGKIHAKCTSRLKAQGQVRILNAADKSNKSKRKTKKHRR